MSELIKLFVVIAAIIILIQCKWKLGYIMLLASLVLGALFEINPLEIGKNFIYGLIDFHTMELMGIVVSVYILSGILKKIKSLDNLVDSLQQLINDYRFILAIIPALLGIIPMPAGAMFSAPMVKAIGERENLTPEEITFVNYWFRHVWELAWPLFSGMILLIGLLKIEAQKVFIAFFPLSIIAIIIGFIWILRNLKPRNYSINKNNVHNNLKKLLYSIWPVLLIILLAIIIKMDLLISLIVVILSLYFFNLKKLQFPIIKRIIKEDLDVSVIVLIASIMIFQRMLQESGGVEVIPMRFMQLGVHPYIILFSIPFGIAFMTGISSAAIGIGIPILLPLMINGEINLYLAMISYVGAYTGMMLSPMHLCLVVTRNYFKSNLSKVYKMIIFHLSFIVLSSFLILFIKV